MPSFPKPKFVDHCERKATHDRKAKQWRDAAWKKHGYKNNAGQQCGSCARCGRFLVRGEGGTVDHIKSRSAYPELKYDVENSRLGCYQCQTYWKLNPLEREP